MNRLFFAIKALAIVGITLAIYLLWEQLARPSFQPCTINAQVNCDAIISGAVAKTLGIPTPLYGLTGYIIIFIAAILHKKKLLVGTALFGLAFCLWIGYRELFELHVICPVCIACEGIIATIVVLSLIIMKKKQRKD